MSNPEPDLDVADMTEILLDRLAKQASAEIMDCARLGRVIMNLRRDLDAEQPKGTYGIGKIFKAGFGQVGEAKGAPRNDAEMSRR